MSLTENSYAGLNLLLCLLAFVVCQSFIACQTKEQKVAAALKQCRELLDKDDFFSAAHCYDTAMTTNPDKATEIAKIGDEAIFNKCVELYDKRYYEQSLICLDPAAVLKSGDANVYFLLADNFYRYQFKMNYEGRLEFLNRAEESVKQSLKIRPDDAAAHWLYGKILSGKFQSERAMREFRQAIKLTPESPVYWINLADVQENSNDYWGAVTSYNQALLIDSDNTLALYNMGLLYEKMDRIDEAILAYGKLLQVEMDYDDARKRLEELKKRREDGKQYEPLKPHGVSNDIKRR